MKATILMVILAIIIGLVAFHYLSTYEDGPDDAKKKTGSEKSIKGGVLEPQPPAPPASPPPTTISDVLPAEGDIAAVAYDGKKFTPEEVEITGEDSNRSCLLRVLNYNSSPLILRLNPHDPQNRQGFPYPPIPAGGETIIDPRYRILETAFHNHEEPKHDFSVKLGDKCKL